MSGVNEMNGESMSSSGSKSAKLNGHFGAHIGGGGGGRHGASQTANMGVGNVHYFERRDKQSIRGVSSIKM